MKFNLFRGKTLKSEKWIYGGLIYTKPFPVIMKSSGIAFQVNQHTIGQLISDSINGYPISTNENCVFEGDILYDEVNESKWLIDFSTSLIGFAAVALDDKPFMERIISGHELNQMIFNTKIIANRWDNPELLPHPNYTFEKYKYPN